MKVPILLPNIFNHPFTYESDIYLKVGDYVVVPFGKSKITGVVWDEFEKKFLEFFGFTPAIWHSGISKKKKEIVWSGIANGEIKVVIGARSSLFLPFKKLGLIIVDEEHDQSFKQDEGVTYNLSLIHI